MPARPVFESIDQYIAAFPADVREVLAKIRALVRKVSPKAVEKISYGIPAFVLEKRRIYFAAFKNHIGIYPPVRGDEKLLQTLAPFRGEKGNLKFPLDRRMPFPLIKRIAKALLNAPTPPKTRSANDS